MKYGILNEMIKREFGTLRGFSRDAAIPKTTLCALINGKYGANEAKIIKRINEQLKKLRPDLDLKHIWDPEYAWYQKYLSEKGIVKKGFRITVDVKLNEKGELEIEPYCEGY